jgi:hypothetical protein
MRIPLRESWRLRAIEHGLSRSEPHLAGMLAIFAKLNAGEVIISREQARRPGNWAGPFLAVLGAVGALLAAARLVVGQAPGLGVRARRQLSRIVRTLLVTPSEAMNFTRSMRSPGR